MPAATCSRRHSAGKFSKPFRGKPWKKIKLARKTLADQVWEVRAAQVYLSRDGKPAPRTHWLIVARSAATGEVKYLVSNAPPRTALLTLMKVAFTRAGVEHVFRLAKTEVGFTHFEGRSYKGLMRHMTRRGTVAQSRSSCQLVLLFAAEHIGAMEQQDLSTTALCPPVKSPLMRIRGCLVPRLMVLND